MMLASTPGLRSSPLSDDDSDFSDFEPDDVDLETETVNTGWLDEVDEVIEIQQTSPLPKCSFTDMLKGKTVHQRAYVTNNSGLYHALCAVEDLEFNDLVPAIQIVLMKSLKVQRFQPGIILIKPIDKPIASCPFKFCTFWKLSVHVLIVISCCQNYAFSTVQMC